VLLDALQGVDARVVVVGFGPERAALERLAAANGVDALFTGPLEHRHLRHLLAFADACVVPSVFPEAFGMVAAEAAAAGCPPIVARHSGLAEVAAGLEAELPAALASLVSAPTGDVEALRGRLTSLLGLPATDRDLFRTSVRRAVERRWSWSSVARSLLDLSS
jgi:glycosyltransferase involved in cell wall biosynthesis